MDAPPSQSQWRYLMTPQKINTFIEMVKSQPELYDMLHSDYKNACIKNKIWDDIGKKFNISGEDAKFKWKNLRDSYGKYLKSTADQSVAIKYVRYHKWQWASAMEFLKEYMELTLTENNSPTPETAGETRTQKNTPREPKKKKKIEHSNSESSTAPSSKNRNSNVRSRKRNSDNEKISEPAEKVITPSEPITDKFSATEYIMLGYAQTIDKFTERRKIITKLKIAQVIMKAELEEEQERSQLQERTLLRSCESVLSANGSNSDSQLAFPIQEEVLFSPPISSQFECTDVKTEIDTVEH